MDKRKGFTLIELLVVIAIIALLMAILMPALTKVRRQAKDLICRSNLRNLGIATMSYLEDFDGKLWAGWDPGFGVKPSSMADSWVEALYPFYRGKNIIFCPEATKISPSTHGAKFLAWGNLNSPSYPYAGSYGENGWCWNVPTILDPEGTGKLWGYDIASFWGGLALSGNNKIPLLADCSWDHSIPGDDSFPPEYDNEPLDVTSLMGRYCLDRHSGSMNVLFFDLTARSVGLKELWTLQWRQKDYYNTCNDYTLCGDPTASSWDDYEWMKKFKNY